MPENRAPEDCNATCAGARHRLFFNTTISTEGGVTEDV